MIKVTPGSKYFWQDRPRLATERYAMLLRWLDENVDNDDWYDTGDAVGTVTYFFHKPEDALAFKLKFGI